MSYKLTLGGHEYELPTNRNCFIDPATTTVYPWPVNHEPGGDEGSGKKRTITETANTGNVGLVRQQGDDQGMVLKRAGAILTDAQEAAMWHWFQLSSGQTIYFVEFNGDAFEVQITNYEPRRQGVSSLSKNGRGYYIKYTIEMIVFAFLAGVAHDAGITP